MPHGKQAQQNGARQLHHLGKNQPFASIKSIGNDTAGDGQQKQRTKLGENKDAHNARAFRLRIHIGGEHHVLHPRSDAGQEVRCPDDAEISVSESSAGGSGFRRLLAGFEIGGRRRHTGRPHASSRTPRWAGWSLLNQ